MAVSKQGGMLVYDLAEIKGMVKASFVSIGGMGPLAAGVPVSGLPLPTYYWSMDEADNFREENTGEYLAGTGGGAFSPTDAIFNELWAGTLNVSALFSQLSATRVIMCGWMKDSIHFYTNLSGIEVGGVVNAPSDPFQFCIAEFAPAGGFDQILVDCGAAGKVEEFAVFVDPAPEHTVASITAILTAGLGTVYRDSVWYEVVA